MIINQLKIMNPFNKTTSVLSYLFYLIAAIVFLQSCATTEPVQQGEPETEPSASELSMMMDTSVVFNRSITGFILFDPEDGGTLYSQNADRHLTPASNTKIYTFYAGMKTLPERVPGLKYEVRGDSLIFWGTGDPSFLHLDHDDSTAFEFLKNRSENLYYSDSHFEDDLLGPGWAWGDYNSYYSAERSPFPIYGNVMRYEVERIRTEQIRHKEGQPDVTPKKLAEYIEENDPDDEQRLMKRGQADNIFDYTPKADTTRFDVDIPFHYTPDLFVELLSDTLGRNVEYVDEELPENPQILYTAHRDTLMKHMMQPSDNLMAEQILLMIASTLDEPFRVSSAINHIEEEYLGFLPDDPAWVDGSGLSRYNLFTPRTTISLLNEIYADDQIPMRLVYETFPAGGKSGTIRNFYANPDDEDDPFVFAKTGTLRHNQALSGYLRTRSGRILIFSFMHNNYTLPANTLRRETEKVLLHIFENY